MDVMEYRFTVDILSDSRKRVHVQFYRFNKSIRKGQNSLKTKQNKENAMKLPKKKKKTETETINKDD
jgi:hypothetical protein